MITDLTFKVVNATCNYGDLEYELVSDKLDTICYTVYTGLKMVVDYQTAEKIINILF